MRNFCIHILLFLILISSFTQDLFAQKEANNWYFGNNAGITFNTSPPSALTDGALTAREGCASISDENGNLLFYSNGVTIWNKSHAIMDNGDGLEGSDFSTQSSLIVKLPGSTTLFYIFTVPDQEDPGAYKYSIVDLSLNGGLGKVTNKNIPLLKNLTDPSSAFTNISTEALTAGYHANQSDIWIVVHEYNVTKFYSYLLTPSGIQQPVVSTVGNQKSYLSQCRISPDGKRIAVGGYFATGVDLFDFNAATGVLSNTISLIGTGNTNENRIYGLSFSANSDVLYVTDAVATIYQFDLSLSTPADIINSKTTVGQGGGGYYPQLQLGPDKRIYLAQSNQQFLGVIEHPDIIGLGCSFLDNGISLSTKSSRLGLPTFMVNYVTQRPLVLLDMIIPNLITPNKDGLNDLFAIKNLSIPDWSLEIYNRWGALVYCAEEYRNDWGSNNVSDGVYYYHLKHRFNGTAHKGWVEVLSGVK